MLFSVGQPMSGKEIARLEVCLLLALFADYLGPSRRAWV